MAGSISPWTIAAITAFGTVLGFALNSSSGILKAQFERRGHWLALRTDIIRCGTGARGYINGGVMVPAGRLPIASFGTSFPALLMAELLTEPEVDTLSTFFGNAESFNRSLDLAQEALAAKAANLEREVSRANLKAGKIATGEGQYTGALAVVDAHLKRRSGHRLLFWK